MGLLLDNLVNYIIKKIEMYRENVEVELLLFIFLKKVFDVFFWCKLDINE